MRWFWPLILVTGLCLSGGTSGTTSSLVLSQANSTLAMRGEYGAIAKVGVCINGGKPIEVDMGLDDLEQVRIDLGRTVRIRELELVVLDFTSGRDGRGVGFSGVELLRR